MILTFSTLPVVGIQEFWPTHLAPSGPDGWVKTPESRTPASHPKKKKK